MKVVFAMPTVSEPHPALIAAMHAELPLIEAAGIAHEMTVQIGCPYISHARSVMTHRGMEAGAEALVYLDHDMSWEPGALLRLIQMPDEVACATYRFKDDEETYMGNLFTLDEALIRRDDGCVRANWVPAGFLKVTRAAIERFMKAFPELCYGPKRDHVDLFNHGAHNGVWFGEDYAFSRRWNELGGEIWVDPGLKVHHHIGDKVFRGDFAAYLQRHFDDAGLPRAEVVEALKSAA